VRAARPPVRGVPTPPPVIPGFRQNRLEAAGLVIRDSTRALTLRHHDHVPRPVACGRSQPLNHQRTPDTLPPFGCTDRDETDATFFAAESCKRQVAGDAAMIGRHQHLGIGGARHLQNPRRVQFVAP
jgi:hypothetical protein